MPEKPVDKYCMHKRFPARERLISSEEYIQRYKEPPVSDALWYTVIECNECVPPSVSELAAEALDAACLSIQTAMGITDGDYASMYFSGPNGEAIRKMLGDYILGEASFNSKNDDVIGVETCVLG